MKTKACFFLSISAMLLFGCKNNPEADDAEIRNISRQRDSVIEQSNKKDSAINAFVASLTEIENNLVRIRQKEELLAVHSKRNVELSGSLKDEVNENIKMINDLTDKNRQRINSLNEHLKEANLTIGQLGGLVDILITNINYKNQDLMKLNEALIANDKTTMKLNTALINSGIQGIYKTDTIQQKNIRPNTAYYIIGQIDELVEKKIVDEKGGFFSPNQSAKINPDFSTDGFTKIDTRQTTNIRFAGKDVKLITPHPSSSYKLESKYGNPDVNLVILDPVKFWGESKYLVISVY